MSETSETNEAEFREHLVKGTRLLMEHKPNEALPFLVLAHELKPHDVDCLLNLGGAYIMAGRHQFAVPLLEQAAENDAGNAQVWTNLGAAYLGNPITATDERQTKALEAFSRALSLDAHARNVAYNMGLIYRDRGETDKAISAFKRALATNPNDRDAQKNLERLQNPAS